MRRKQENINKFIQERFVTCYNCGYNNAKGRLSHYGTCLRCGIIIDNKSYFKRKLEGELNYGKKEKRAVRSSIKNL